MLIRTQDKMSLIDITKTAISVVNSDIFTHNFDNPSYSIVINTIHDSETPPIILGTYSSEEKAIKVLDEIQEMYTQGHEWLGIAGKVFNMPKEENK